MVGSLLQVVLVLYLHCQWNLRPCSGEETLLWTQTSSVWSSINGIRGDLDQYANSHNTIQGYRRVRSESAKHANKVGLTYDPSRDLICWSDDVRNAIYCQNKAEMLNRTTSNVVTVIDSDLTVGDLAMDWATGNIYLAGGRYIVVGTSRAKKPNIYKFLLWKYFQDVSGIAVDTKANKLFWTDTSRGCVECSTLLGSKRLELVNKQYTEPMGITVLQDTNMVYWVDRKNNEINWCQYDGNNRKSIPAQWSPGGSLYGIAFTSRMFFVTNVNELTVDIYEDGEMLNFKVRKELDAIPHQITALPNTISPPSHDCESKQCEHICLNEGDDKGRCTCQTGYFLDFDGKTCKHRDLIIVHATEDALLRSYVSFNESHPSKLSLQQTVLARGTKIRPVAYHFQEKILYYGSGHDKVMFSGNPMSSEQHFTEHTVNTAVEGITVDWLAGNVYWTDKELHRIMVSRVSGRYHKLLMSDVGTPTDIAVDPINRFLFWNDATNYNEKIWRSGLDGSSKISISRNMSIDEPAGLFLDHHSRRLYCVDNWKGEIFAIDYDGNGYEKVLGGPTYYDLVMYQELAVWTARDKRVQFQSRLTGAVYDTDGQMQNESRHGYGVIAFDDYFQPIVRNPCAVDNGGCAQLCFLTAKDGRRCGCAVGFELNSDGRSCDSDITEEDFLLYTDPYQKQVYQTSLADLNRSTQGVPGPLMDRPISVDYDTGRQRYFWFDQSSGEFMRSNGASADRVRKIGKDSDPSRLVVDPVYGWIYYTDIGRRTLSKMTVDGSKHTDLFTNLDQPFDIALDYENKTLVWSTSTSIEMSNTEGEGRRTLREGLSQAGGVAILPENHLVYFSSRNGTIYSFDLTNEKETIIYENASLQIHSLAVSGDHIYFSAYNDKSVYRINRTTGESLTHIGEPVFARVTDIKIIGKKVKPQYIGFNWAILAAALAALLLLLLLVILAAVLGRRRFRNKKEKSEAGVGTGFDGTLVTDKESEQDYTYINNSKLYDMRLTHDTKKDGVGGDHGINGKGLPGSDLANGSIVTQRPDLIEDNMQKNGNANGWPANGSPDEATSPGAAAFAHQKTYTPEEVEAINQRYKPKKAKKKTLQRNAGFELAEDKVATRIQRLAKRLRNGLSSIRWSSGDRTGDGETANPTAEQGQNNESVEPTQQRQPLNKAVKINGPPVRYEMPRGYAPASHSTPAHIKGT